MMDSPRQPEIGASTDRHSRWSQRWMWIVWPAFLIAAVLEMVVFAVVDPSTLHWFGQPVALSGEAVYTLSFFVFWGMTTASSALTVLLAMPPFEVNR